jgi:hypothetical protein
MLLCELRDGVFSNDSEKEVTLSDLNELERYLDALYASSNIDFEFTRHFLARINDARNRKQITAQELFIMFGKAAKKYGEEIANLGDNAEAVISDLNSRLNSPFVLNWDRRSRMLRLVAKTIMRKKNFKTRNKILRV